MSSRPKGEILCLWNPYQDRRFPVALDVLHGDKGDRQREEEKELRGYSAHNITGKRNRRRQLIDCAHAVE
uniref:Uncharacterized protein n=1 Tax=Candidatus Kentrum sp. TUN TaxID=2126343 RepID=A0A451A291_9GAMM|nr:MAG: hypothetical protein BECKTUN1418D_GA0071000_11176 [Candidatus Kentron sp. TUN]